MSTLHTLTYNLIRGDQDIELEVEYNVVSWGSLGSYWDPPEGMEIEVEKITLKDVTFEVTPEEQDKIETYIHENPPEWDDGYDD